MFEPIIQLINQTFEELQVNGRESRDKMLEWVNQDVINNCGILANLINDYSIQARDIDNLILLFMYFYSSQIEIVENFTPELIVFLFNNLLDRINHSDTTENTRYIASYLAATILNESDSENPDIIKYSLDSLFRVLEECINLDPLNYMYKILILVGEEIPLEDHFELIYNQIILWIRKSTIPDEIAHTIIDLVKAVSDQIGEKKTPEEIAEIFEFLMKYTLNNNVNGSALQCIISFFINAPFTVSKYDVNVMEVLQNIIQNNDNPQSQILACEIIEKISDLPFIEDMVTSFDQQIEYSIRLYQVFLPHLISLIEQSPSEIDNYEEYTPYIAAVETLEVVLRKIVSNSSEYALSILGQMFVINDSSTTLQKYVALIHLNIILENQLIENEYDKEEKFIKIFELCDDEIPRIRHLSFQICSIFFDQIEIELIPNLINLSFHIEDELPIAGYVLSILSRIALYQDDPAEIFSYIIDHLIYLRPILTSENWEDFETIINDGHESIQNYFPSLVELYQNTLIDFDNIWVNNEIAKLIVLFVGRFQNKLHLDNVINILTEVVQTKSCFSSKALPTLGFVVNYTSNEIKIKALECVKNLAFSMLHENDINCINSASLCFYYIAKEKNMNNEQASPILNYLLNMDINIFSQNTFCIIIYCISALLPITDIRASVILPYIQEIWPFGEKELNFLPKIKFYASIGSLIISFGPLLRKEPGEENYYLSLNLIFTLLRQYSFIPVETYDLKFARNCVYLLLQAAFSYPIEYLCQFLNEDEDTSSLIPRLQAYLLNEPNLKMNLYEIKEKLRECENFIEA